MKDEELALELTKIQMSNADYKTEQQVIIMYRYFLNEIEQKEEKNRIAKIKRIYEENEGKEGSWCGYNGIKMLDKIQKIVNNQED